jgi:hypothetical protein
LDLNELNENFDPENVLNELSKFILPLDIINLKHFKYLDNSKFLNFKKS